LWALHITPSHATGRTQFSLVYGSEAILPTEVEHMSFNLTRLEELYEVAVIQSAKHQQAMRRYHVRNISSRSFEVGDFIIQKIQMTKDWHKLSLTWKGPYEVVELTRNNSYRLQ
jgi:hypothetical protein